MEPIIQTGFYPSTHDIKGMLAWLLNLMGRKERKTSKREGTGCSVFCFFRFFRPIRTTQAIEAIKFEITVLAGKPTNLPYTSLSTLFKGRDEFLAELRQHLSAEGPVVIKGKRTIHGMGGVGKTRAAIEYAWKHADDYRALLFISADTPEALHRNLAALSSPLVLNLPEQNEKEQALQVTTAKRYEPDQVQLRVRSTSPQASAQHLLAERRQPHPSG